MNREVFDSIIEGLTIKERKVLKLFLSGESDYNISKSLDCQTSNVRKHMSHICKKFGLFNLEGEHYSYREDLKEIIHVYKPSWINFKAWDDAWDSKEVPIFPGRPIDSSSKFYVERSQDYSSSLEDLSITEILEAGALIRIQAASNMGKTSLLNHILRKAEYLSFRSVRLNIWQPEPSVLESLDTFLKWFCSYITKSLSLNIRINDVWDSELICSKTICTLYFEEYILKKINTPLVLGLDNVDRIFEHPRIANDFFSLLRVWHEQSYKDIWQNLRIVISYSSEVYINIDPNQSPFNIGKDLILQPFSKIQVQRLALQYGLSWSIHEASELMSLVGGHPYLIQLAFYALTQRNISLSNLIRNSHTNNGIYYQHLQNIERLLNKNLKLREAFLAVIAEDENITLESVTENKLQSLWLIHVNDSKVKCSCELYRNYFSLK